jgi:hypothetical protein
MMTDTETIICKPTKWFLWRAIAMLVLFLVMGVWFLKDGRVGYPKKNVTFYTFKAFESAKTEFTEREKAGQTATEWEAFAKAQRIPYPEEEGILPLGVDRDQPWPDPLLDYEGYLQGFKRDGSQVSPVFWREYSNARGWGENPKTGYDAAKIRNQVIYSIVCGVLVVGAAFFLIRCLSREMKVDGEAFYAPGGARIPFASITRIDKRKWDTKGLATLTHRPESGGERKTKVDGMVYGQFRVDEGAPAQALFDRILANFSGELVELEVEESPQEEEVAPEVGEG